MTGDGPILAQEHVGHSERSMSDARAATRPTPTKTATQKATQDLTGHKRRRVDNEHDAERALRRLAELNAAPAQKPSALVVRSFAETWPTLSVDVRRDVAGALLSASACVRTRRWRSCRAGVSR